MDRARKHLARVLCLSLLLVFILSTAFLAEHAHHDCQGAHCEICAIISYFGNTFKQLATAVIALFIALAAICCLDILLPAGTSSARETPISLKVQLNN